MIDVDGADEFDVGYLGRGEINEGTGCGGCKGCNVKLSKSKIYKEIEKGLAKQEYLGYEPYDGIGCGGCAIFFRGVYGGTYGY
mmetsp:Transcript_39301/g.37743  ORF Transcript_39301/g.37743 Transcript_39301/m.37743 type:complete len:83 (+) Transcript_39301:32-280(+)